jgi:hypothetical protein
MVLRSGSRFCRTGVTSGTENGSARFPDWKTLLVWREGFSGWKKASDVAELFVGPPAVPKAKIVRREVRMRGFFGWFFLILFFAFNALMLWSFVDHTSRIPAPMSSTVPGLAGTSPASQPWSLAGSTASYHRIKSGAWASYQPMGWDTRKPRAEVIQS